MSTGSVVMTATGNSSAVEKNPQENYETITIFPTAGATAYTGVTFTVEASVNGTNYEPVLVLDTKSGLTIAGGTAIAPTDETSHTYAMMFANNYTKFRVNVGAISTGSATFLFNGSTTPPGPSLYTAVASGAGTFTNLTASGTLAVTGATTLSSTLAAGNTTITGTATISSTLGVTGALTATGGIVLPTGADIAISGTTGQNEITVTDNLADALSVKVLAGADLIVLTSTDNAEAVAITGLRPVSTTSVAITGATTLKLSDSNGIFTVGQGSAYDIDLPSPTTGANLRFNFQLVSPGANAVTITVAGSAATFEGSIITEGQIVVATGSTLTFASGTALLGDNIEIISTSTSKYMVRAVASALNGITVS